MGEVRVIGQQSVVNSQWSVVSSLLLSLSLCLLFSAAPSSAAP
jgi:hypothetical protein